MSRVGLCTGKLGIGLAMATCLICLLLYYTAELAVFMTTEKTRFHDEGTDTWKQDAYAKSQSSDNPLLRDLRNNGLVDLPPKAVLKSMSADSLNKIYHSYLDNTDILCHRKLRMGKIGDGGWEVCDDEEYRPKTPCLVYSYGIHNDFSFDDDIARLYQCQVFSFDPSMSNRSHQRTPLDMFLQVGIASRNYVNKGNWTLETLNQSKERLNHIGRIIDVLKIDVEFAEWDSLPQIIESGEMSRVRQLLMEYHGHDKRYEHLAILKDIHDLGFRKFYVHKNPSCKRDVKAFPVVRTYCYEVHYVNTRYSSY